MKKLDKKKLSPQDITNLIHGKDEFKEDATLDFHNFGIIAKPEIQMELEDFLEMSHIHFYKQLLIITGKGQVVRPYVKQLLSKHKLVKKFQFASYYNGQNGAFEVTLI